VVRSLTRELNEGRPARGQYACPSDTGGLLLVVLGYPAEPDAVVEVQLAGCRFALNGFGNAAFTSGQLIRRLERLAPLRRRSS